ncbi:hypothetical protein HK096_002916, partial [Nowakowskiella sp. JEL0078]
MADARKYLQISSANCPDDKLTSRKHDDTSSFVADYYSDITDESINSSEYTASESSYTLGQHPGSLPSHNRPIHGNARVPSLFRPTINLSKFILEHIGKPDLNLSRSFIKYIPPEIGNLTSLERLGLSNNSLTYLPNEISKLTQLRYVNLKANSLKEFPSVLSLLPNLEVL